jgi:DNA-directed RNA polymerase subunit RPC12/RpoP
MSDSVGYVCAHCGAEYDKGWSEAEAVAEFKRMFDRPPNATDKLICDDCHELIMKWMRTREMTRHQMLDWLSKEDASLYGECKGELLTELVSLGFVFVGHAPPGRSDDYRPVGLTPLGLDELKLAKRLDDELGGL